MIRLTVAVMSVVARLDSRSARLVCLENRPGKKFFAARIRLKMIEIDNIKGRRRRSHKRSDLLWLLLRLAATELHGLEDAFEGEKVGGETGRGVKG